MENTFIIVQWPESQYLMDKTGFEENCFLGDSHNFQEIYGSSAYFANQEWFTKHFPETFKK